MPSPRYQPYTLLIDGKPSEIGPKHSVGNFWVPDGRGQVVPATIEHIECVKAALKAQGAKRKDKRVRGDQEIQSYIKRLDGYLAAAQTQEAA